jgi:hypothetical protein
MTAPLNGPGVRDAILKQGKITTESAASFWENITKGVHLTVDSGRRVGT